MSTYSVIFDGQKVPDSELFGVKQRLREVFKADRARIETLFAGKPVAIKRNLSREEAIKYQHMLKKMGVEVSLVASPSSSSKAGSSDTTKTSSKAHENEGLSLAPLGSDLLDGANRGQAAPQNVDIDHLQLTPQQGNILQASERPQTPEATISNEYTQWDLSSAGQDLLKQSEKQIWEAADIDTSNIQFADKQSPLAAPTKAVPKEINTDHLTLRPTDKS